MRPPMAGYRDDTGGIHAGYTGERGEGGRDTGELQTGNIIIIMIRVFRSYNLL